MRKIFLLLTLFLSLNAKNSLLDKDYWLKILENKNLKYGYYEDDKFLIVVDKVEKNLKLFEYKNGDLNASFQSEVIVGKSGDKLSEGDLKTPIGTYELTRRFKPSDSYYGPLAFSLSYPNLLDKIYKRKGSGIWIHGYPMSGVRDDDVKTKGCVALKNDILINFDKKIDHKRSLALIYENYPPNATNAQISAIISEIYRWKKSWQENDINGYLKFYDENFTRFDGLKFSVFAKIKEAIFKRGEQKSIVFSNLAITPYPNQENKPIFRVNFYEDYASASHKFSGQKTLYLRLSDDEKIKIFIEE